MLRIFGRTTLVSQFMVRSEMRLSALTGIWRPGPSPTSRDSRLFHAIMAYSAGLFRAPDALRERGHQIGDGADGFGSRAFLAIEAGAKRIDQSGADHGAVGILGDCPSRLRRADAEADADRQFGMPLDAGDRLTNHGG